MTKKLLPIFCFYYIPKFFYYIPIIHCGELECFLVSVRKMGNGISFPSRDLAKGRKFLLYSLFTRRMVSTLQWLRACNVGRWMGLKGWRAGLSSGAYPGPNLRKFSTYFFWGMVICVGNIPGSAQGSFLDHIGCWGCTRFGYMLGKRDTCCTISIATGAILSHITLLFSSCINASISFPVSVPLYFFLLSQKWQEPYYS